MSTEDPALLLVQGLCNRLCHDLAGPLGAIGSGTELLGEEGGVDSQIVGLLNDSADNAAARLRYMRAILGTPNGRGLEPGGAQALLVAYLKARGGENAPALDWCVTGGGNAVPRGRVQVLLNLALVVLDALPRCERLAVIDPGGDRIEITASGPSAARPALLQGLADGLAGAGSDGDPVRVHAIYTGTLLRRLGLEAQMKAAPGALHLFVQKVPGPANVISIGEFP